MRKVMVILLLVGAITMWAGSAILELEPAVDGEAGSYRVVKDVPSKSRPVRTGATDDIADHNWVIQYDNDNWAYYTPRTPNDTMAVRFVSPAKCSLVAFTWISYCSTTGTVGEPANVFVTDVGSVDYSTYPGVDETDSTTPTPLGAVQWSGVTACPANMVWDTVDVPTTYVDTISNTFFCGWNPGVDQEAGLAESIIPKPDPIDCHTYYFSSSRNAWFAYYYTGDDEYVRLGMRAYVKAIENLPPAVNADNLPNSYDTGSRTVWVGGSDFGPDSSGVTSIDLIYRVNGGSWNTMTETSPIIGTIASGVWEFDIPGVSVGDMVEYFAVGKDWVDARDTTATFSYTIMEPGAVDFLYVVNDDDPADILPEYWQNQCDVWDIAAEGMPDSSVITAYNTVVWRDWGCMPIGPGLNLGSGIRRSDSTWIKLLLDNGGNFWLSDQDMGYGLGICPNYGQQPVGDMWVRNYLGIKGMYDDSPLSGASVTAAGNPMDPVVGDLFNGIGSQTMGSMEICPNYPYVGVYDSIAATATPNVSGPAGEILSFRYTGPSDTYKVFMDFYPFDWIVDPADTTIIDRVAVDSLVEDVLVWFGVPRSGVSDETIEAGDIVRLSPVNSTVTKESWVRFYLPDRMPVSLSVYDNTGRLVKNLVNGTRNPGIHTERWDAKVANGVYFYHLTAGDKTLSDKIVIIR